VKVLLINNYHYRRGGADGVYFNTAELLTSHGHEVFYFSTQQSKNIKCQNDKSFATTHDYRNLSTAGRIRVIPSFFYNRNAYKKLLELLEEINPDLAHIHLFMGSLSSSILMALKKKKIPVAHTVHDYRLICPAYLFIDGKNKVCEKCKDRFYMHCTLKRCSENSFSQSAMLSVDAYFRKYFIKPISLIDCFIFVSEFSRDKHIEFNPYYRPKSEMLYNFNPELNSTTPTTIKGKYFLYFGRISREKGLNTLIEASLKARISLKIIGVGPLLKQVINQGSNNIDFLGFKNKDDLWPLVKSASFVIVPSEWYENNPLSIIEAYSFGKPVIGARIGGIPEIIKENKTGYLFNPGNKFELEQLLTKAEDLSDSEYAEMSTNARAFAEEHFHPDNHYNKLLAIYEDVIKNKNKL